MTRNHDDFRTPTKRCHCDAVMEPLKSSTVNIVTESALGAWPSLRWFRAFLSTGVLLIHVGLLSIRLTTGISRRGAHDDTRCGRLHAKLGRSSGFGILRA